MILEESLVGNPLVQIVWQRLQYLDISRNSVGGVWRRNLATAVGYSKLGRYSEGDELEAYSSGGRSGWLEDAQESKARVSPRINLDPGGHGAAGRPRGDDACCNGRAARPTKVR